MEWTLFCSAKMVDIRLHLPRPTHGPYCVVLPRHPCDGDLVVVQENTERRLVTENLVSVVLAVFTMLEKYRRIPPFREDVVVCECGVYEHASVARLLE